MAVFKNLGNDKVKTSEALKKGTDLDTPRGRTQSNPEWMQTFSGARVDFIHPDPQEIHLEDIAHHLALMPRFNGATEYEWSVCDHCILTSTFFAGTPHLELLALLHDAPEAYIGDIISPVKAYLKAIVGHNPIKALEDSLFEVILKKWSITRPTETEEKLIMLADMEVINYERQKLMNSHHAWSWDLHPVHANISKKMTFRTKEESCNLFISEFQRLLVLENTLNNSKNAAKY